MKRTFRKSFLFTILVLSLILALSPASVEAETLNNASPSVEASVLNASAVTHYLPYSPSVGKIRVNRTGLLYKDYYASIGFTTVNQSTCTVTSPFCYGLYGEYHDYGDDKSFTRGAIDFTLPAGADVLASASGTVYSKSSDTVAVKHIDGTVSYYVHVVPSSSISVGQSVSGGQKLAVVLDQDSNSHLHYALWEGSHEIMVSFADDDAYQYGSYLGYLLPSRGRGDDAYHESFYRSQNGTVTPPPTELAFTNGSSSLSITQASVNLRVCATNLTGKKVYATLYRGASGSDPARTWSLSLNATSTCVTFSDMDGAGETLANVTYYTVASLNPIPNSDAIASRTTCYSSTSGKQLCDAIRRDSVSDLTFSDGESTLAITQAAANLEVCASNLTGKTVYATMYRDAYASYSARTWRYQKTATSNCVSFSDMDGSGDTFSGVTYYTVASLNPISDSDATSKRTSCYAITGGKQLCDAKSRTYSGTLFVSGYSSLEITQAAVNLRVCADNLNGKSVNATLYRDAYSVYPARTWRVTKTASSNCVTFSDMDGSGDTYSGITYYTVASLNYISDSDASNKRTACYTTTGGVQLCDAGMRGTAPTTCYSLTTLSAPSSGGGVNVSPISSDGCASGSYQSGAVITLTAVPASGYSFQSWTGASGGSSTTVTITSNKTVTANFSTAIYNSNWMPDSTFTGELDISVAQIRNFLSSKGSCLANPILDVDGQEIDIPSLIYQASQRYEINPKVILATMQKEQSAITNCPSSYALSALMGAGSPSTARQQIDFGTSLFRAYLTELQNTGSTRSGWKVGIPKTTVDGVTVTPASRAVAALFTYTPYAGVVWGGNMPSVGGTQLFKSAWDLFKFNQAFPAPACYDLTLTVDGEGGFIIADPEPNCDGGKYTQETSVDVWVIPYEGFDFDYWSGSVSSTNQEISLVMTSNKNLTAHFVNLNDPPVFTSSPIIEIERGASYQYNLTASDPNLSTGDVLTLSSVGIPQWLSLVDNGDGTGVLSGVPGVEDIGVHSVEIRVEDSSGLSDTQSFTITVYEGNQSPLFTSHPITDAIVGEQYLYSIEASDPDLPDEVLTITAESPLPSWLSLQITSNGHANLIGQPDADDIGEYQIQLMVTDGELQDYQTFTIIVGDKGLNNTYLPIILIN